ncbi:hypothetical protein ACFQY7_11420 [Actinomadura luteofluorescens]|uniref:hypothetical protein n=1 Tax=Actinomadura luteofluorescens TaxID=46163 RepID=UPI003627B266
MAEFTVYDETDAPADARPQLEAAKKRMGFVTTLNGVMAESPELLAATTPCRSSSTSRRCRATPSTPC